MSTEAAQEQSAPTTETASFNAEAYEALTDARLSFAPQAEIDRLTALVSEPPKEPEPVTETPTTEAEVVPEETTEEEEPAAEVPETATGEEPKPDKEDEETQRFRFKDPEDRLIAQTAKTKKISLAAATALLNGTPVSKEAPKEIPGLPVTPEPTPELKAMEDELATVRAKLKADKADGVLATEDLDTLEDRRAVLIVEIAQAKVAEKQSKLVDSKLSDAEFTKERNTVLKSTVSDYPEMAKPDSAQYRIAKAIGLEWRDPNHPMHDKLFLSEGPRLIAEEAAKVLNIQPVTVEVPKPKPKVPVKETPKPGPAPGSRTSAAPTTALTAAQQAEEQERQVQAVLEGRAAPPPRPVRNWA